MPFENQVIRRQLIVLHQELLQSHATVIHTNVVAGSYAVHLSVD